MICGPVYMRINRVGKANYARVFDPFDVYNCKSKQINGGMWSKLGLYDKLNHIVSTIFPRWYFKMHTSNWSKNGIS